MRNLLGIILYEHEHIGRFSDLHKCIFKAEFYVVYFLSIIFCYYISLCYFKNIFACFCKKECFCLTSTIIGNMQSALLGVYQIIADICVLARASFTSSVAFSKLFLRAKFFHMNLMYWCQNT